MKLIKTKGYESNPEVVLILAHGAGAPADSAFMEELSLALSREGIVTVRFEFPYMQKRRADGRKRPPAREPASAMGSMALRALATLSTHRVSWTGGAPATFRN